MIVYNIVNNIYFCRERRPSMSSRPQKNWYKLDNAAKIIPATVGGPDTRVFRLVCELKKDVDPVILQKAVDETAREFPHLNVCLRSGIFWYYLDECRERPLVTEDTLPPLSALYRPGRKNLLYRVTYFRRRINIEMFHVIADGTGAYTFAETLITNYFIEKYDLNRDKFQPQTSSIGEKSEDAFSRYYTKKDAHPEKTDDAAEKEPREAGGILKWIKVLMTGKAYRLTGQMDENMEEHLIEGVVSAQKMLEAARGYQTTIGILAASIYVEAIVHTMRQSDKKHPVVISVPVNLRNYFPSSTTRNFFGVIKVSYDAANYDGTLESVIPYIAESFRSQLTIEKVTKTMNSYAALEHNLMLKTVPLPIKNAFVRLFNGSLKRGVTASLSNVGKVHFHPELVPYIDKFTSFMSGPNVFTCISTFEDYMAIGLVSCFTNHDIALHFFRRLSSMGIPVELSTNDYNRPAEVKPQEKGRKKRAKLS